MIGGILFGLGIAMPVGPVALVSMDYGMRRGFVSAFWFGLGAAVADAAFALIAYLGSEALNQWLELYHRWFAIGGALFLLSLGIRILTTNPGQGEQGGRPFLTGILLTVANPLTILAFIAFLAIASVSPSWIAGVFVGSLLWWTGVAGVSSFFGRRLSLRVVRRVRQVGGALICLVALWFGLAEGFARTPTASEVVVHETHSLHERVDDGGANEAHAPLFEVL